MKFFAYGVEVIDVVVRALGYSQCGPGSIRGLDAIFWWGFWGLLSASKGVFQVLWIPLYIKIQYLIHGIEDDLEEHYSIVTAST